MVKKTEDISNGLDTIPVCDGRAYRQTDILSRHSPRYVYPSRGKTFLDIGDPLRIYCF